MTLSKSSELSPRAEKLVARFVKELVADSVSESLAASRLPKPEPQADEESSEKPFSPRPAGVFDRRLGMFVTQAPYLYEQ